MLFEPQKTATATRGSAQRLGDARVSFDGLTSEELCRVNVVGVSGSGKSTLARRLGSALDSPVVELDRLYWGPDWTPVGNDEFRQRISRQLAGERWIVDGNYHTKCHDLKWQQATAIVWVDLPFLLTMRQAVGRAVRRAWSQQEIWPGTGNRESFRQSFFSHDSVVLWTATSYRRIRKRYAAVAADPQYDHIRMLRLRTREDMENLVTAAATIARRQTTGPPAGSE